MFTLAISFTAVTRKESPAEEVLLIKLKMADQKSCGLCPKSFASKSSLCQHRQNHSGGKSYDCSHCSKSFGRAGHLKTHTLIHTGEKPHKCPQCNFATKHDSTLKRHIKKHTGEKPHKCNQCDFASIQSNHLKGPTLGKNLTDVQCATFPQLQLVI